MAAKSRSSRNRATRWLVSGGYEPIARPIFENTAADRLLLEYDDERSGGFEPLAAVPDDKVAVLGLRHRRWAKKFYAPALTRYGSNPSR